MAKDDRKPPKKPPTGSDFELSNPSGQSLRYRPNTRSGLSVGRSASVGTPLAQPLPHYSRPMTPEERVAALKANEKAQAIAKFQKKILSSAFDDDEEERTQLDTVMGKVHSPVQPSLADEDDEETTVVELEVDGETPLPEVISRDAWRAIDAPVQSRSGRRSAGLYRRVIDQFAVAANPRYAPDPGDKVRAHIFIWDVTRAMNAEVPHFVGAREQNLNQTCDWLRLDSHGVGWRRADAPGAIAAANKGLPVLVLPKEIKLKMIAIVRPGDPDPDGNPYLSAAGHQRGNRLTISEAFATFGADYFIHS